MSIFLSVKSQVNLASSTLLFVSGCRLRKTDMFSIVFEKPAVTIQSFAAVTTNCSRSQGRMMRSYVVGGAARGEDVLRSTARSRGIVVFRTGKGRNYLEGKGISKSQPYTLSAVLLAASEGLSIQELYGHITL